MASRIQGSRVDSASTSSPPSSSASRQAAPAARETPGWIHALASQWEDERSRPQAPYTLGHPRIDED